MGFFDGRYESVVHLYSRVQSHLLLKEKDKD